MEEITEESEFIKSFGNDLDLIKAEASKYHAFEQAVKLMLNSIYGAFGNPYFYFFNVDIAETITLQGKDAILYTEKLINRYFKDFWHKDTDAHEAIGIKVTGKIEKPVGIYIDTDSIYVKFDEIIKKSDWEGSEKDFILKIYKVRLADYIEKILQKYADDNNAENFISASMQAMKTTLALMAKDLPRNDGLMDFDTLKQTVGFNEYYEASAQYESAHRK